MASSIPASGPAEVSAAPAVEARGGAGARRTRRLVLAGGLFVLALIVVAAAAPWIAPQDPTRQSLRARLKPPTLEAVDGKAHLLGTDHLGRDVLSRMLWGARVSLLVGFAAVGVGGLVGALLGIVAGYRGGWADTVIMTVADAQLAFPFILLAIGIIAVLGPSFPTLVVVIGLSGWMSYARVLRSQVLVLRSREFVDAIHALGGSIPRVIARHIVPNILSSLVVIGTLELARSVVLEATLSFLGIGLREPVVSWGVLISDSRNYIQSAPHLLFFPAGFLVLTVLAFVMLGDAVRDALDPKQK